MDYMHTSHGCGVLRLSLLATAIAAVLMPSVQAVEVDTGSEEWSVRFDNTGKFNYGMRTESADARMLATPNNNDGDYNFKDAGDTVTTRFDLLTELDVVNKGNTGFRISAASWYDYAYRDVGADENPFINGNSASSGIVGQPPVAGNRHLSDYADRYYHGPSGELLDAFVFHNMEVGDESLLGVKIGQHNIFWGETLLSPVHALSYGQSGLDISKSLAVPGTEAKELFIPRNQLSTSLTVNPELTLAAQYFLDWDAARLPESGTYLGFNDGIQNGGHNLSLIGGRNPLFGTPGPLGANQFLRLSNGHTFTPDNQGDFGLMAKWSPEWLDGTLGFYYRNTSDILPNLVLQPTAVGPAQLISGNIGSYNQFYVDDIDIYGISLAKSVGPVSVGLDVNYRENMPLISNFTTINGPLYQALAGTAGGTNLIGEVPGNGETGLARGKTLHVVLNGLVTFGATPLWDASSLAVEGAMTHLVSVDKGEQTFKGDSSYEGVDKVTTNAYTLAVNFTPTWFQALPGVDISMPLSYNVGLKGNSAVQLGGNEDSGSYSVGIAADVYQKYKFDLKYVDSFGKFDTCETGTDNNTPGTNGRYQCIPGQITSQAGLAPLLKDRGMVTASFKTTF